MLYVSSPVLKQGPFYEAFTVNSATFITFVVGLTDCSRIAKEKITDIFATHGERIHPFTRSKLYEEFMDSSDSVSHIPELNDSEATVFALKRAQVLRSSQTWGAVKNPDSLRRAKRGRKRLFMNSRTLTFLLWIIGTSFRADFLPIELRQSREPGVETNPDEI